MAALLLECSSIGARDLRRRFARMFSTKPIVLTTTLTVSNQPNSNDGGRSNLAGMLYQLLGVGALRTVVYRAPSGDDLDVLFGLIVNGKLTSERFGQDAVVEKDGDSYPDGVKRQVFIQFKYSSAPEAIRIAPAELLGIVDAFRKSEKAALESDQKSLSDFVLLTNRELSELAHAVVTAALNQTEDPYLGKPTENVAERAVLKRLQTIRCAGALWLILLRKYAVERGIFDHELNAGVGRLIGELVYSAAVPGGFELTAEWLNERLAGVREIRVITPAASAEAMQAGLKAFRRMSQAPDSLQRRDVVDQIESAFLMSPIVILIGPGGNGKTVALYHCLWEMLGDANGYAVAQIASTVSPQMLAQFVGRLRGGAAGLPPDNDDIALGRLVTAARSDRQTVLGFGIDGIDEGVSADPIRSNAIADLLTLAWNKFRDNPSAPPQFTVVASCRTLQDLQQLWPSLDDPQVRSSVSVISVGTFSDHELLQAARDSQPADIVAGLELSLSAWRGQNVLDPRATLGEQDRSQVPVPRIAASVVSALRHPTVWRCFTELPEARRRAVINNDQAAQNDLARAYLERFTFKLFRRRRHMNELGVSASLIRIAHHTRDRSGSASRVDDWIGPACQNGEFERSEAKELYSEALSFGVIALDDARTWRWTQPFIQSYLISCNENP